MNNEKHIRQITLPQVGNIGQQKLQQAHVLIVGAGGLGNAILPYLASSGIGAIGIIDGDYISMSNLHRQILFSEIDINKSKAEIAGIKLRQQYPDISITIYNEFLSGENALQLFKDYDIIVDATDKIEIRYLINDACLITNKPFVHASVYRFQFQVATFNVDGSGTYRCLYPNPPKTAQNCTEAGVMPSTVAMAGLYQANEVFKYILSIGELLTHKVLLVDTMTNQHNHFTFQKKNYKFITEEFFNKEYKSSMVKLLSLKEALNKGGLLLDVREPEESPKLVIENYKQISLGNLEQNLSQLAGEQFIYIFCQSGKRSAIAYQVLKENKFSNIFCLKENAPEINKLTVKVL
jgi:molybdopterin/thiamine biosynthesis adenylyltransferase/rhodanese-related sulfurtransferase